jgi:hercynylcysteine S-oxide lyase
MANSVPFGRQLREKHFLFDGNYVPLNHGSFGAFPRCVKAKMQELSELCEAKPDTYIRRDYFYELEKSREVVAGLLNVSQKDIVYVSNATVAFNAVIRSLVFKENDVIITFDTSIFYTSCTP